jgi:hypothetical protein
MNYGPLWKNTKWILVLVFITVSCSEDVPKGRDKIFQAKEVILKNNVPSCCSKKPSRFLVKKVFKETLR